MIAKGDVNPGRYRVFARLDERTATSEPVDVAPGATATVEVRLPR